MEQDISWCGAFVCQEVATFHSPILYAVREAQSYEEDSGWQFGCGASDEVADGAQIWAFSEVLAVEPSLAFIATLPVGSCVIRESGDKPWVVIQGESA